MLALNISSRLGEDIDVRAATEKGWKIRQDVLDMHGDVVVAVANGVIKEVFTVRSARPDPNAGGTIVFDLAPAPEWRHVIGDSNWFSWQRGQDPVKKVHQGTVAAMRRQPREPDDPRAGWHLDVADDGKSAVVRGPGTLAVTGLADGQVRVTLFPDS